MDQDNRSIQLHIKVHSAITIKQRRHGNQVKDANRRGSALSNLPGSENRFDGDGIQAGDEIVPDQNLRDRFSRAIETDIFVPARRGGKTGRFVVKSPVVTILDLTVPPHSQNVVAIVLENKNEEPVPAMSFCPVCGAHHDPEMPCFDRTEEILRDAGIHKKNKTSEKKFRKTVQEANRSLILLLLILAAGIPLAIVIVGTIMGKIEQMMH